MNFTAISVNYQTADLALREQVSFSGSAIKQVLQRVNSEFSRVKGAVLLSTCNRTELYLSTEQPLSVSEAEAVFCHGVGQPAERLFGHITVWGHDATVQHLFALACGLKSMILGEDQIITQLKEAAAIAAQLGVSDGGLNTLFRHAITCGKRVKSTVQLKHVAPSMAGKGIAVLADYFMKNPKAAVLVIGNGEVGRNACQLLVQQGCRVYMTLRKYKNKETIVPAGCIPVPYEERATYLPKMDIVVSATKSPHHTITYEMLEECTALPRYILDLAVPRDIDPRICEFPAVQYYDVDAIGRGAASENLEELSQIEAIIAEQTAKFTEWMESRQSKTAEGGSHFPIFINLQGRKLVVIGGGKIAARRIKTLLRFGGEITVVAPQLCEEITKLNSKVTVVQEPYEAKYIENAFFVITATDDAAVNNRVCADCRSRGILVNTAHDRTQCDFFFPAMFSGEGIVGGLISQHGQDHKQAKETAQTIREYLAKGTAYEKN